MSPSPALASPPQARGGGAPSLEIPALASPVPRMMEGACSQLLTHEAPPADVPCVVDSGREPGAFAAPGTLGW